MSQWPQDMHSTSLFLCSCRVLYFSIHRYEHGSYWPELRESDYHYIGKGRGLGYNVNIPLNKTGMTDADYMAVFHQVLLPLAHEVNCNTPETKL